jgi:peptidoglycan/LPS O-acetylase OafA/YrhL
MRVFRIYPALIICNIITVFFIGAIFTTLSVGNYFSSIETWRYIINNNVMFIYIAGLPGVFKDNLYKDIVNGSLWTLPTEIRCYFLVVLLGALGCLKKNIIVIRVSILFFGFLLFRYNRYIAIFFQGQEVKALFFLTGMLAYTFRNYLIISKKAALVLIGVCLASYFISFKLFINVFYLTLLYSILVVATLNTVKKIKLPGDYSYGIYVYGFLVQQILAHSFPKLTAYPSMLISIPIVFLLGVMSWHYIEFPALTMARNLSQKYQERSKLYYKDLRLKDVVSN